MLGGLAVFVVSIGDFPQILSNAISHDADFVAAAVESWQAE